MNLSAKKKNKTSGQAAIETALALPFLIYLFYYTLNAFHAIHTSHVGQKWAAMNLYTRLNNRSKFVIDGVENVLFGRTFMAVQYVDANGAQPKRRILIETGGGVPVYTAVGVCREPACN